ncbi:hypothetical protein BsWGS_27181 [Bradybaena similaris]
MSVTVKVFFERIGGSVEIRRFLVNTTDGDFFAATKEKIKCLYAALVNSKTTLYWKDPNGYMVAFTTLEEMKEALKCQTDGVFRVYVFEEAETLDRPEPQNRASPGSQQPGSDHPSNSRVPFKTPNQSQPQGPSPNQPRGSSQSQPQQPRPGSRLTDEPVHRGICCNAYQGPVKDIRCTCCVCPDFDSRKMCEANGARSEHDICRIIHPNHLCRLPPGHPVFSRHSCKHTVTIHRKFTAPGAHGDTFKTPNQSQPQQPRPGSGHTDEPVYRGNCCNACQGPVKGIRCKCCVCPNFNLCKMCETNGARSEHDMCKMNRPHPFCRCPLFQCRPMFSANCCSSTGPIPGPCTCLPGRPHPVSIHRSPGMNVPRASGASASASSSSNSSSEGTNTDQKEEENQKTGKPSADRQIKIIINNTQAETSYPTREQSVHLAPNGRRFQSLEEHVPQGPPEQRQGRCPLCGCQQGRQQSGCPAMNKCTRQCRICSRGCCLSKVQPEPCKSSRVCRRCCPCARP